MYKDNYNTYYFFRPKRYLLADLVDWFYALMRKDEKWGYVRYDMKYDPIFFPLKVMLVNLISPAYPLGGLHWESIEKVIFLNIFLAWHINIPEFDLYVSRNSFFVA